MQQSNSGLANSASGPTGEGPRIAERASPTPGPWTFSHPDQHGTNAFWVHQQDGAPYTPHSSDVATLSIGASPKSVVEADARLIAAAPDLYGALEVVVAQLVMLGGDPQDEDCDLIQREVLRIARAALNKASPSSQENEQ